jgi:alpha-beta hydrolase superfamily lysophospholipase
MDSTKPHKGTIVAVHGLTLYAHAWDKLGTHLAARGYHVYALDMRGYGRWRSEAAKYGGNSKIAIGQSQKDLFDLVNALRQANANKKLYCLGESLGSNMILELLSKHNNLADGAILGSPCHKTRVHPNLRWTVDFAREVIQPVRPINLTPYSAPYLTNDQALAKACNNDPLIYRKMTPVELVKVDVLNGRAFAAAKSLPVNLPLLIIAGAKDDMFKAAALSDAVAKFGSKNISLHILPGKGHLLLEHQSVDPQILILIDTWLDHDGQRLTGSKSIK